MLPTKYRLKRRSAFAATYRTGKTLHVDGITLFVGKENKENSITKVGFVVSKRVHKRAVKRNRVKRLMRESYRLLIKQNLVNNRYISLIFAASSKLLDKNFFEIDSSIKKLVAKIWLTAL